MAVDAKTREALKAAGWKVGNAAEFLGLTEEEQQIMEFRLMVGRGVRRLRETHHLTQRQLAARIGSNQSRVAKIEAASSEVSLDLMLRGFFSAGGRVTDLIPPRVVPESEAVRPRRGRAGHGPS
jgi:DNA-binding XRE family transcriptional regulator